MTPSSAEILCAFSCGRLVLQKRNPLVAYRLLFSFSQSSISVKRSTFGLAAKTPVPILMFGLFNDVHGHVEAVDLGVYVEVVGHNLLVTLLLGGLVNGHLESAPR